MLRETFRSASTILWDWNGTLLNDPQHSVEILNETIAQYGIAPITFEQFREYYEHPLTKMYERLGVDLKSVPFAQLSLEWHTKYEARSGELALYDGAVPVLERFRELGKKQHVLSALPQVYLEPAIGSRNIRHFFESLTGSRELGRLEKYETGTALLEELAIHPGRIVLIGDSSHDAEVAKFLGIGCVLVSDGLESPERLQKHGFPIVEHLIDLLSELT